MPIPRPAPGRARLWLLATLGILAMTAVAVWFGLSASLTKPTWQTVGFSSPDRSTILLKYSVVRPEGMPVRCLLLAKDGRHAVVGSLEVDLPPEWGSPVENTQAIRTTSQAVVAEVRSCREM